MRSKLSAAETQTPSDESESLRLQVKQLQAELEMFRHKLDQTEATLAESQAEWDEERESIIQESKAKIKKLRDALEQLMQQQSQGEEN